MHKKEHTITIVTGNDLLCKKYKVDRQTDFTLIMVGKDGSEKLRTHSLLPIKKLIALKDAMPMRKEEMRNTERKQ